MTINEHNTKKRKILIDGLPLLSPLAGIGRYTYENAKRFRNKSELEIWFDYGFHSTTLYSDETQIQFIPEKNIRLLRRIINKVFFAKKIVRYIKSSLAFFSQNRYDIYWQPNFIPVNGVKSKNTVTSVHDFSFMLQPQWHPKERLEYFNENFLKNIKNSDHIITGSYYTKQEILKYLDFPDEKITVIYHGVDHTLFRLYPSESLLQTKKKYDLPDSFVLFVGSIEPRKNLLILLKAYTQLAEDIKQNLPLVLVGFKGWQNKEIMQEIQYNKKHVIYLGYLSDEELAHVYNLASIFVYPSLYEGFGIPPLEAMACGTPVIASRVSSLPEVCKDAALYIDPENSTNLEQVITTLYKNKVLQEQLRQKGLEHVKQFTWEKSSKAHFEVFDSLMKKKVD